MIRLLARTLAAILLEVATVTLLIAVILVVVSAYLTGRFVGIDPKISRRLGLAMKVGRDVLAMGVASRRRPPEGDT